MTVADMLREKGHLAGLQEGMEKGFQRGRLEGMHEVVVRMLIKGLSLSTIAETTDLSLEQIEEIRNSIATQH